MLNKTKGNMYPWVTHTWNPIKGKCSHECVYCYMNRFPQGPLRLDEKCLKDNLGEGNTIFVGSNTDMFASKIYRKNPTWVGSILRYIMKYPDNIYLFQSKNPYLLYWYALPKNSIVGTTAETNRSTVKISKADDPIVRLKWLYQIAWLKRMISIEPILDFDLYEFLSMIKDAAPSFVSIGADSKNHKLPEPPAGKIKELISELQKFTEVKIKPNLARLMK